MNHLDSGLEGEELTEAPFHVPFSLEAGTVSATPTRNAAVANEAVLHEVQMDGVRRDYLKSIREIKSTIKY